MMLLETARQKLGTTIRFYREKKSWPPRRVADVCGISVATLEDIEHGRAVPDSRAWKSLRMAINHSLGEYAELYHRACVEQESEESAKRAEKERRKMERLNGTNGHAKGQPITTSLGAKLVDALIEPDVRTVKPGHPVTYQEPPQNPHALPTVARMPVVLASAPNSGKPTADQPPSPPATPPNVPPPARPEGFASDGRRLMPKRPPNSMTTEAIEQRKEWARAQFRVRPAMRFNGDDGILALMRNRFGVGLDPQTLSNLKAEVHAEINKAPGAPPPGFTPKPDPVPPVTEEQPIPIMKPTATSSPSDNIAAAVSLLLEAVPHLKSFTIEVDEHGEASCSYTQREVRIVENTGTMKVRR